MKKDIFLIIIFQGKVVEFNINSKPKSNSLFVLEVKVKLSSVGSAHLILITS